MDDISTRNLTWSVADIRTNTRKTMKHSARAFEYSGRKEIPKDRTWILQSCARGQCWLIGIDSDAGNPSNTKPHSIGRLVSTAGISDATLRSRCGRTHGFAVSCAVWGFHRTRRSSHTPFVDTLITARTHRAAYPINPSAFFVSRFGIMQALTSPRRGRRLWRGRSSDEACLARRSEMFAPGRVHLLSF
jgi:hypothetical protein